MPCFVVWVHDRRLVKYVVNAADFEEAERLVKESEDADIEFGGSTKDGEWYVDHVDECGSETQQMYELPSHGGGM